MKKSRLGNNPFAGGGIDSLIRGTTEPPEEKQPEIAVTQPRPLEGNITGIPGRPGRPTTIRRQVEKASQIGLQENYTRATFILREDLLEKLKDYAYTDRRSIKDIVSEMLEQYLKDKEVIKRGSK